MQNARVKTVCVWVLFALFALSYAARAEESGSIVGWGGQVVGLDLSGGFTAVAAGYDHNLGLKQDGSIVAWGDNLFGQCNVPEPNTGFVAVAANSSYNLGLKADGSIVGWGDNYYRQCDVPTPNTGFIAISGGAYHALGLKADGSVVAWGNNASGQGDVPAPNAGFVAVAAGGRHSMGLKADGSIVIWGSNAYRLCEVPEPNRDFVAVAAGFDINLGLKRDGSIVTWGSNANYQLNVPAPNSGFVKVSVTQGFGSTFSVGLKADGSVVVWGPYYFPPSPEPNTGFVAVAPGMKQLVGLKTDGSVVAWGSKWYSGQDRAPEPNANFVAAASETSRGMALKPDGAIQEWGDGHLYAGDIPAPNAGYVAVAPLGRGNLALRANGSIVAWGIASEPPGPNTGFVALSADLHNLGLKEDGSVVAWGSNDFGQCTVPAPNTNFGGIAAGRYHSLGVKTDGSVVAWGKNDEGQCNVPLPNTGFVAVSAGWRHSVGLRADGSIVAWGYNADGQCDVPEQNRDFVAVAAGAAHSLGLKADGSIVAWGRNVSRECEVPLPNAGFITVVANGTNSLAIRSTARMPIPIGLGERVAGTARPNQSTDYRLELQAGHAPHLLVRVYPLSGDGTWVLRGYEGSLSAPLHEWLGEAANESGVLELLIPSPAAGTYFFSLRPYFGADNAQQPFEIEVLAVERHLGRLTSTRGGNTGTTTFQLPGLGFEPGVRVELRDGARTVLAADMTDIRTDRVTGQFNLAGVSTGVYDVVVVWPSGAEETLPDAFEVTAGTGPRLEARVTGPTEVRAGRTYTAWVEYWNAGDSDLIAPLLYLTNTQGIEMKTPGTGRVSHTALALLGIADRAPLGTLIPGARNYIPVTFVAQTTGECRFELHAVQASDDPVDWAALEPLVRPCGADDAEWDAYWGAVTGAMGSTWAHLLGGIAAVLNRDVTNAPDAASLRLFDFGNVLSNVSGELVFPSPVSPEPAQAWDPDTDVTVTCVGTFDPARPRSVVVSHAWNGSKDDPSIAALGQALANCGNSNVFLVDWRKGAAGTAWGAGRRAVEAGPAAVAALRAYVVGHGGDASFWATVTYIGCSEGNVVNKVMAEAEGAVGKGLILDPAYQWGGAPPAFATAYSKSVSIGSMGLMDANPCSALVRGDLADVQYLLEGVLPTPEDPVLRGAALRALVERLEQSRGCADAWLTLDLPAARDGAAGFDGISQPLDAPVGLFTACAPSDPLLWAGEPVADLVFRVVRPVDPNEKTGPAGTGSPETERFVQPGDELPYVVYFENKCSAEVPAQEVVVTDDLDADLDWSTFRLTEIAWGEHRVNILPDTSSFYARETVPDPRPGVDKTWWVDVNVDVNYTTGRVQWRFRTLDPDTGELPEDVHAGFLPPNAIDGACVPDDRQGPGEAHVAYTVRAKRGLAAGTRITNTASIVFDTEAPIVTNEVFNTIPVPAVPVPDVVGKPRDEAILIIYREGLDIQTIDEAFSATVPAGSVVSQEPSSGTLPPGGYVNLVVSKGPGPVAVPNVVSLPESQARAAIAALGLTVGTVSEQYSTSAAGMVIAQDPATGTLMPGSAVALVVSKGPEPVVVPNVVGMTQTAARTAITAVGLVVGGVSEQYSPAASDAVIGQEPASGTLLPGSAVNLVVSKGPAPVAVPSMVGLSRADALAALAAAGLGVGTVSERYSEAGPVDVVLEQEPASGMVPLGTPVALVVSTRKRGDVDRSGGVNATDVQLVINAALGRSGGLGDADVDGDGRVNASDVQLVINAVLGRQ